MTASLIRGLRGKRSQTALSRRLGYRSNVVYTWESGRREPSASELFRILDKTGRDPRAAWATFPIDLTDVDLTTPAGIAELLSQLRGETSISAVARRAGVSRFTASRWLRGISEPRVSELLGLVEALTFRLLDLLAALVPVQNVPGLATSWRELETRRRVAFTHPWSHALLREIETTGYRQLPAHSDRYLARALSISVGEVSDSIAALAEAGLVRRDGAHWATEPTAVDTSMASREDRKKLRLHWADVGRRKIEDEADGLFSWAVVALSERDYEKLRQLHVRYMTALRQLVDESRPSEVVAVANVQLFRLGPSGG